MKEERHIILSDKAWLLLDVIASCKVVGVVLNQNTAIWFRNAEFVDLLSGGFREVRG